MIYRELLLGCGHRRDRIVDPYLWAERFAVAAPENVQDQRWINVLTVDLNRDCGADYIMNLAGADWRLSHNTVVKAEHECLFDPWPLRRFRDGAFDEVHAYEVLEHLGQQGDQHSFFAHFETIWKMLRTGGFLCATVPSRYSQWLWGDPGHRRAIYPCSLVFLNQAHYERHVGRGPSSDYRSMYHGNFHIVYSHDNEEEHRFVLQALPPLELAR